MPFPYIIHSYEDISPRVRLIRMIPEADEMPFECGQYVKILKNGYEPRPFSIASTPRAQYLEFYIGRPGDDEDNDGLRSFLSTDLCAGQKIEIDGPFGEMKITRNSEAAPATIYGLAGGTGISPVRALIVQALEQGYDGPIVLYYGVRDEEDLFILSEFQSLAQRYKNFRYEIILSDAEDYSRYRRGFVHDALIVDLGEDEDLQEAVVYLSGPPVMISASLQALLDKKLKAENLHTDRENLSDTDLAILAKSS